ncbi:cyclophane-forming radical SAM/SPASM peptide maturase GrrM/OscB [uncultured Psychroserpens sp.]|uniref:cyclophane-forming radical SAM/SPASM peptide maturase GrrM/OscB n=1 Tax=uncultured Psychroserpens sp. TaxID=255436 RepID=UPI00262939F9|nr:cyclophane-forming radical SAM/SPASM peptide maturase GrrM/OscB [uncultured Psychroserpens sp.]
MVSESLDLLIFQGTPFCNIDCRYCYLPNRLDKRVISTETIKKTIDLLLTSNLIGKELSIVWHCGEPLVIPIEQYKTFFDTISKALKNKPITVKHSFQTNGLLINKNWVRFFKKQNINLGLSIDGPETINDVNRITRSGKGTYNTLNKSLKILRDNDIDFHVIAVITKESIDKADELYDFFKALGISRLGLNIEEIEGSNTKSSFIENYNKNKVFNFFNTLYNKQLNDKDPLYIRELDRVKKRILYADLDKKALDKRYINGQEITPFKILSVDVEGNLSTFSPELMGQKSKDFNDFLFGNIFSMNNINEMLSNTAFKQIYRDITSGVKKCIDTCQYYDFCGGGSPSNKFFENGTFDSTITYNCKASTQIPLNVVLNKLSEEL